MADYDIGRGMAGAFGGLSDALSTILYLNYLSKQAETPEEKQQFQQALQQKAADLEILKGQIDYGNIAGFPTAPEGRTAIASALESAGVGQGYLTKSMGPTTETTPGYQMLRPDLPTAQDIQQRKMEDTARTQVISQYPVESLLSMQGESNKALGRDIESNLERRTREGREAEWTWQQDVAKKKIVSNVELQQLQLSTLENAGVNLTAEDKKYFMKHGSFKDDVLTKSELLSAYTNFDVNYTNAASRRFQEGLDWAAKMSATWANKLADNPNDEDAKLNAKFWRKEIERITNMMDESANPPIKTWLRQQLISQGVNFSGGGPQTYNELSLRESELLCKERGGTWNGSSCEGTQTRALRPSEQPTEWQEEHKSYINDQFKRVP